MQHLISLRAELKHSVVDKAVDQWHPRLSTHVRDKGQLFEQLLNWNKFVCALLGAESRLCSAQCKDDDGCWGPADNHCRRCADYRLFDGCCVAACDAKVPTSNETSTRSLYVANTTLDGGELQCRPCHPQCRDTCYGDVRTSTSYCGNRTVGLLDLNDHGDDNPRPFTVTVGKVCSIGEAWTPIY